MAAPFSINGELSAPWSSIEPADPLKKPNELLSALPVCWKTVALFLVDKLKSTYFFFVAVGLTLSWLKLNVALFP